jgi:predicted esterase
MKVRNRIGGLWALLFVVSVWNQLAAQQVPRSLTAANNVFIGFYEYKPVNYSPTTKYPLIIFLHGIGERGNGTTELPAVLNNGVPKEINSGHNMTFTYNGDTRTFLVLSPQLSKSYGNWQNFYVDEMIKYAKANLSIDTNRIYLTGLSLGGGGTWKWATSSQANAQQLAAIAPVCGTCEVVNACHLTNNNVGVWAFHANDDGVVGVGCTKDAEYKINQCTPNNQAIFTYYPNGGHSIWNWTYRTDNSMHFPNMYQWFISRAKNAPVNQVPIARAGNDTTLNWPANVANLNGGGSYDPDGTLIFQQWTKITGPTQFTITNPNALNTTVTNLVPGLYSFSIAVRDNSNILKRDTMYVHVVNNLPNQAPVAIAGNDIDLNFPNDSLFVSAWQSYDPDGAIVAYNWAKISGPTNNILSPNSSSTWIKNMQPGAHTFRLTVTDNQGAKGYDTLVIRIFGGGNQAPIARAGADQSITLPANSVTLNGSTSSDPDGSITAYLWDKIAGPAAFTISNPTSASTNVSGLVQGTYQFRLRVTDNAGATALDTVQIIVSSGTLPNQLPIAVAGNDIQLTLPQDSLLVSAWQSSDPDGSITAYQWTKLSGPTGGNLLTPNNSSCWIKGMTVGTYQFQLRVTDNAGAFGFDTLQIFILPAPPPPNQAPIANAGADINLQLPTNSASLNGSGSSDPDGQLVSYQWQQIAGTAATLTNANAAIATVSNLTQGTFRFRLTVTDNSNATASDTLTITVSAAPPPPNQAPIANAGADINLQLPTNSASLNGSGSSDPDGSIIQYAWSRVSGPGSVTLTNSNTAQPTVFGLQAGTHVFELEVTDNVGAKATDRVQVIVAAAANQAPRAITPSTLEIELPNNAVDLDGTASIDSDGTILQYQWRQLSGPSSAKISNGSGAKANASELLEGTYQFELAVTDNQGAVGKDTLTVKVLNNLRYDLVLQVYPNPVVTQATVRLLSAYRGDVWVRMVNMSGNVVYNRKFEKSGELLQFDIPMSQYRPGTYVIQILGSNRQKIGQVQILKQ